jgi:hypothetical protein
VGVDRRIEASQLVDDAADVGVLEQRREPSLDAALERQIVLHLAQERDPLVGASGASELA